MEKIYRRYVYWFRESFGEQGEPVSGLGDEMLADCNGVGVEPVPGLSPSADAIEMARDMTIIKLRARKVGFREIGRYLGLSAAAVHKRYHAIPEKARDYYRRESLDWLG